MTNQTRTTLRYLIRAYTDRGHCFYYDSPAEEKFLDGDVHDGVCAIYLEKDADFMGEATKFVKDEAEVINIFNSIEKEEWMSSLELDREGTLWSQDADGDWLFEDSDIETLEIR